MASCVEKVTVGPRSAHKMTKLSILIAVVSASSFISGCAGMVTANDGSRVTVEHDFFIDVSSAQKVAERACSQNGAATARHIATANKNPRFEKGSGVQLSTFQCQ